jgi:hypothetical protein
MSEATFEVVWPSGRSARASLGDVSVRPDTLDGLTVAFIWDYLFRGNEIFELLAGEIESRYRGVTIVGHEVFGDIQVATTDGRANLAALPERLQANGVDVAVVAVGACGGCMPAIIRAAAVAEGAGVRTVAIGATGFEDLGRSVALALGIGSIPIVTYPGVIPADTSEVFVDKVRRTVLPEVVDALVGAAPADVVEVAPDDEPEPTAIVFSGTFDEVQDHFDDQLWSDGLPIVPPTIERVERFLAYTDRRRDEVLAVLPHEQREATVWNVAVNAVMAGCRPEYMPVLLAVVECLADPCYNLEGAGSTSGREPLVIVSGPMVEELEFNAGTGVMRVGRRANSSVGRFARLFLRNVPGFRIPPGTTDKAAIGQPFNVALAEDDAVVAELGWPSFREDHGFDRSSTVVSVHSVNAVSAPIYSAGDQATDHLETISSLFANAMGPWALAGVAASSWYPLLVLGPGIARALHAFGLDKDDIREHLADHTLIAAGEMERYARQVGANDFDLARLVAEGRAAPRYARSDDPTRLVPMFVEPSWIQIVVAGNPNRNQSRAYVNLHRQGGPPVFEVDPPAAGRTKGACR